MADRSVLPRFIVSTDLDGTLLDHHNYDWRSARPALQQLQAKGIPVIFNTSKNLAETRALQEAIDVRGLLIVENGSALAIPTKEVKTPFTFLQNSHDNLSKQEDCQILLFGVERSRILAFIKQQRHRLGPVLEGFEDWSTEDIAARTGLSLDQATLSRRKQYSEPFVWLGSEKQFAQFENNAREAKLKILKGGRFFHLQGNTNKATPLHWLREQFKRHYALDVQPKLICLGDNQNDVHMLNAADIAVCIKSPVADYPQLDTKAHVIKTEHFGPQGWNRAILDILSMTSH